MFLLINHVPVLIVKMLKSILKKSGTEVSIDNYNRKAVYTITRYNKSRSDTELGQNDINERDSFKSKWKYLARRALNDGKKRDGLAATTEARHELDLYCYLDLLRHKSKVEHAAFIDLSGQILIQDSGLGLDANEASAVARVLGTLQYTDKVQLFKLSLIKQWFTCYKTCTDSFVGMADNYFIMATRWKDYVLFVVSDPDSPGSCINQVNKFTRHVNSDP